MTTPTIVSVPWPEGVLARYLTVGGATIDITVCKGVDLTMIAQCNGCAERTITSGYLAGFNYQELREHAITDAKKWAQSHAGWCRAMPKPAQGCGEGWAI